MQMEFSVLQSRLLLILLPWLASGAVDFNRDVRPILSDRCFFCHGPDNANRKAGLRFDTEAGAKANLAKITGPRVPLAGLWSAYIDTKTGSGS